MDVKYVAELRKLGFQMTELQKGLIVCNNGVVFETGVALQMGQRESFDGSGILSKATARPKNTYAKKPDLLPSIRIIPNTPPRVSQYPVPVPITQTTFCSAYKPSQQNTIIVDGLTK